MKETQRVIRFRTFNPKYNEFHYWGFIDGHFKGPPTGSGLTIEECSQSDRFSGLQDSKGVDIYESDVLKSNHFHDGKKMHFLYHRILWDHKHTGWMAASSKSTDLTEPGNTQLWVYARNAEDFEVIGHIYDPKFSHLL
jgi:hypothetical protein